MDAESLSKRISSLALNFYKGKLPKNGKPVEGKEWTVFSAIVKETLSEDKCGLEVVAAGTGSKCLGENEISSFGDLVHDSHAEVIARRAFLRYLMNELAKEESIFTTDDRTKLRSLNNDVRFHFFSTHPPCGDATIADVENFDSDDGRPSKRPRLDQWRTGAKPVQNETPDLRGSGRDYNTSLGALRLKPGRGDPTKSLSCSDKLVKWSSLGFQGSLIASLLSCPVRMHSFTFVADEIHRHSIERALFKRFSDVIELNQSMISILQTEVPFAKRENKIPSPLSIIFSRVPNDSIQIGTQGRKQGCTKKQLNTEKSRLKICRLEIANEFIRLIRGLNLPEPVSCLEEGKVFCLYSELKNLSHWHCELRQTFLSSLSKWPRKNHHLDNFFIRLNLTMILPKVFLFKAEADKEADDEYQKTLEKLGFNVKLIPVIQFRFCTDELSGKLDQPNNYQGIIFTSPRAVKAVSSILKDSSDWSDKDIFAVGAQTSKLIMKEMAFSKRPDGDDAGNADKLSDCIIDKYKDQSSRPNLLFPTGNLARDSMQNKLGECGIKVDTTVCYETLPHDNLASHLNSLKDETSDVIFVFFSPSGVKSVFDIFNPLANKSFKIIALGPSTQRAIQEKGLPIDAVCEKPNSEALIKAIDSLLTS